MKKIEKLANGNVVILANGVKQSSFPKNMYLHLSSSKEEALIVSNHPNPHPESDGYPLHANEIEATILEGTETPFVGNVDALMDLLSESFFLPSAGSGGTGGGFSGNYADLIGTPPVTNIAAFRPSQVINVNTSTNFQDLILADEVENDNWAVNENKEFSYAGDQPLYVEIEFNINVNIVTVGNSQRTNQLFEVIREDGEIIGASRAGYIRAVSGHNETSFHIVCTDENPNGGFYKVRYRRETTITGAVNLIVNQTKLTLKAKYN